VDHAVGRDQSYYLLQGDGFSGDGQLHLYGADFQSNQYLHLDGVDERNHLSNQRYRHVSGGNVTRRNHHGDPGWPTICTCCSKCAGPKWSSTVGVVTGTVEWFTHYLLHCNGESGWAELYIDGNSGHTRD
jgi:hypothetical protein